MVTRETPAKPRATRRRLTRGATSDGEDTTEPVSEPVVVKRTTRRLSVVTLEPETDTPAVTQTASHQNTVRRLPCDCCARQLPLWSHTYGAADWTQRGCIQKSKPSVEWCLARPNPESCATVLYSLRCTLLLCQVAHPPTSNAHISGYHDDEKEDEKEAHEEKPAVSERIRATAAHVGEQVHDTAAHVGERVSSVINKTGLNWRTVRCSRLAHHYKQWHASRQFPLLPVMMACYCPRTVVAVACEQITGVASAGLMWHVVSAVQLATLLTLAVLTSWLTSRMAQPDLTKRQLSGISKSIDQANSRYTKLVKELEDAQGQVQATEDRCARSVCL